MGGMRFAGVRHDKPLNSLTASVWTAKHRVAAARAVYEMSKHEHQFYFSDLALDSEARFTIVES